MIVFTFDLWQKREKAKLYKSRAKHKKEYQRKLKAKAQAKVKKLK